MLRDNFRCWTCDYTTYMTEGAVHLKVPKCPRCGSSLGEISRGGGGGIKNIPDPEALKEGETNENKLQKNESKE